MHSSLSVLSRGTRRFGGAALALGVAFGVALLAGCGGGGAAGPVDVVAPAGSGGLKAASDTSLTAYFRTALGSTAAQTVMKGVWATDVAFAMASVSVATPGGAAASFSGTTLQEAGVDEADRIKSDGRFVFDLSPSGGELRRQRLNATTTTLAEAGTLTLPWGSGVSGQGQYLDTERGQLAVLGQGWGSGDIYANWFAPQSWGQGVTEVALVNAPAEGALAVKRTLRFGASLIGSRRIGATLYLVLRSYPQVPGLDPWWPVDKTAANQAVLDKVQASALLPTLAVDGGAPQPLVAPGECLTQTDNASASADVITLVAVDLAASTHRHAARCFTGGTEAFYMSDQALYLATTRNSYSFSGAFPVYAPETRTDVHKFALSGMTIAYRGSGTVTGHLGFDQNRKSFRMGEHNGALHVITQTQPSWGGWIRPMPAIIDDTALATTSTTTGTATKTTTAVIESPGRLTILKESAGALAVVGELPNAARPEPLGKPGEQLYASRFIGNRGYLVTYRLTDPLYILDLSNPADPKVAGALEVSGYSDYLFPLGENLLLGVGKEAISDGSSGDGRFAWYQGVQVSLIDVSDPAHPREAARSLIGRRGTDATVLRDHHGIAMQTVGGVVRVGLPVSLHDTPMPGMSGAPSDYFGFTRTELQRFEVNLASQSLTAHTALMSSLPEQRDISHDRSLLWNNQVHWYQNGTWLSAGWQSAP
jgi:hypothetical protein